MYSSLLDLKSDLPHCSVAVRMSYIMATIHTLLTHSSLLVRKIILYWHYLYYRKKLLEMAAHFFKVTFEKGMSTISRHLSLLSKRSDVFFKKCCLLLSSVLLIVCGDTRTHFEVKSLLRLTISQCAFWKRSWLDTKLRLFRVIPPWWRGGEAPLMIAGGRGHKTNDFSMAIL